jgi:hypothetical protein
LTAAEHTVGKQFQSVPHVCVEQEECNNNGEKTTPERITVPESTLITATEKGASTATMAEEVCAAESLSVDRLRQLLSEEDEEDDRTLLDVFGEVTKEYLTTKVVSSCYISCINQIYVKGMYRRKVMFASQMCAQTILSICGVFLV